jgi:hypothetical protein
MRSPDEYEAAFYADTTNANPDTPSKLETPNRASNKPGTLKGVINLVREEPLPRFAVNHGDQG